MTMNRVDIVPGSARDVETVVAGIRERDAREFMALSFADTREALAEDLALVYGQRDDLIAVRLNDTPVAVGLTQITRPGVVALMFFATDDFPKVALPTTRFIRRLFRKLNLFGVHRIECVSIADYVEAHRWIRTLGLKQEAILKGFGKNGETCVQFSKVYDVRKTGSGK